MTAPIPRQPYATRPPSPRAPGRPTLPRALRPSIPPLTPPRPCESERPVPRAAHTANHAPSHSFTRRPTPAEKARESKLRADALCEIANPQLVRCRRCYSWIKLSAKSAFDPAHWHKHRERCVRRSEGIVQELRETNDQVLAAVHVGIPLLFADILLADPLPHGSEASRPTRA